jgi:hypothetical protein
LPTEQLGTESDSILRITSTLPPLAQSVLSGGKLFCLPQPIHEYHKYRYDCDQGSNDGGDGPQADFIEHGIDNYWSLIHRLVLPRSPSLAPAPSTSHASERIISRHEQSLHSWSVALLGSLVGIRRPSRYVAGFVMRGRMGGMPSTHLIVLKKLLATIEQRILDAERCFLATTTDEERERLIDTIAELHLKQAAITAELTSGTMD